MERDVVVQGNPRVYKALKNQMADMLAELQRIEAGNNVSDDLLNIIELIAVTMYGLKGDAADDEEKRNDRPLCICWCRYGAVITKI